MATYTIQLNEYIENFSILQKQDHLQLSHREKIERGRKELFDFDYPLFDESYRNVFETHFIRNFYMREIGFETMGLFKFHLENWLVINMPYFNKLFESELIEYDVLENTRIKIDHNKQNDKAQSDKKGKKQDDLRNISKDDVRNIDQSSKTDGTSHSDTQQDIVSTGKTTGKSSQDTTAKDTTNKKANATQKDTSFIRDIESNTPDSRLAITTEDGKGVIQYASLIKENTESKNRTNESSGNDTTDSTSKTDGTSESNTNVNTDDKITSDEKTSSTSKANQKDTFGSKIKDTYASDVKETYDSGINEIEDFIMHKVGKLGNETYPEMVQKYRKSLLRIERMIFDEMQQLFMLVY